MKKRTTGPAALEPKIRRELRAIARWQTSLPCNRTGSDKRWVVRALLASAVFYRRVAKAVRVDGTDDA